LLTAGCEACKVAWIRHHKPAWFERAQWILSPRDYVFARLTGTVQTDRSLASRTGFYALDGAFIGDRALGQRLPPMIPSLQLLAVPHARELALPLGVSAILGAGDRACEVIGVGATATAPMVSWGTTVNVSVPSSGPEDRLTIAQVSRDPGDGYVVEAGLSAGGAALDWLADLTGSSSQELLTAAATVPPGANGVLAFPWLHGARAPWWRPDSRAAFLGVTSAHGPPDLARALMEGIALDTARSVDLIATGATNLFLAGAGARNSLWRSVLAAVTNCRTTIRAHTEAASVGARALVALANREPVRLERLNPVGLVDQPQPAMVETYQNVRKASDAAAHAILGED
jgi:xylulokinase